MSQISSLKQIVLSPHSSIVDKVNKIGMLENPDENKHAQKLPVFTYLSRVWKGNQSRKYSCCF